MLSGIIYKILLPLALLGIVSTILISSFGEIGLNFAVLQDIFIFIKSAMKSFDWLVPYETQMIAINTFIFVEFGIFAYKVVRFIMKFFGLNYEKSDNQ